MHPFHRTLHSEGDRGAVRGTPSLENTASRETVHRPRRYGRICGQSGLARDKKSISPIERCLPCSAWKTVGIPSSVHGS
jgi:hypothetical protein